MTDVIYHIKGREMVFRDIIPSEAEELLAEYGQMRVFLFGNRSKGNKHVPSKIWTNGGVHIPTIAKSVDKKTHIAKPVVKPPKVKTIMGVKPAGPIEWYSGPLHEPILPNRGVKQDDGVKNSLLVEG